MRQMAHRDPTFTVDAQPLYKGGEIERDLARECGRARFQPQPIKRVADIGKGEGNVVAFAGHARQVNPMLEYLVE